jgi:hypothetical protein
MLSPAQRSMRARLGARSLWAHCPDRSAQTQSAREAFIRRFEREVDPEGILPTDERTRRAEHARQAYFVALSLKSARVRAARRAGRLAK